MIALLLAWVGFCIGWAVADGLTWVDAIGIPVLLILTAIAVRSLR